ncbi:methyl-accepting chemotaxis protein [Saccharospirillum mangrovi]|uniref:methyl-accepting chemotaxis protein n=1 Tax=Saccharospirillum mangrovi TaxID=2161747 RepID=UPI000D3A9477|nr:methyl-accepting chemotaxis protein [Saccharospirillum mangrovi]
MIKLLRAVSIGTRLAVVLGLIVTLLVVLGVTSLVQLRSIDHTLVVIDEHRIPSLHAVNEVSSQFLLMRVNTANLLAAETEADQARYNQAFNDAQQRMNAAAELYLELIQTPSARSLFEQSLTELQRYQQLSDQLRTLVRNGDTDAAISFSNTEVAPEAKRVTERIAELVVFQETRIHDAANEAHAAYGNTRMNIIEIMALATGLAAIIAWLLARSITVPIRSAVQTARNIANKDLTTDILVDGRDEATVLLTALNDMQDGLRTTLSQISQSAEQLATSSEELSQVTNDTTAGLQRQTEEMELAASAVTELSAAIEEVAANATGTASASKDAEAQTQHGQQQVQSTLTAIHSLVKSIEQNAHNTEQLAVRVGEVAGMLEVIQGVAEQTNLLALNAAIEAARAGDQGRGFAVVADEVRGLAQRTADSTKEIEEIIHAVNQDSQVVTSSLSASQISARETLTAGTAAGEALERIAGIISDISQRNLSSASASEQQAAVAREVDRNLTNIKDLSAQTAAGAEETQAASADLARLATSLNDMVARFRV